MHVSKEKWGESGWEKEDMVNGIRIENQKPPRAEWKESIFYKHIPLEQREIERREEGKNG